jgi:hypothetical protein
VVVVVSRQSSPQHTLVPEQKY